MTAKSEEPEDRGSPPPGSRPNPFRLDIGALIAVITLALWFGNWIGDVNRRVTTLEEAFKKLEDARLSFENKHREFDKNFEALDNNIEKQTKEIDKISCEHRGYDYDDIGLVCTRVPLRILP